LDELAALLLHPSVPATTQQAVLAELVSRAMKQGGTWLIGLAGLRRAAALGAPIGPRLAAAVKPTCWRGFATRWAGAARRRHRRPGSA